MRGLVQGRKSGWCTPIILGAVLTAVACAEKEMPAPVPSAVAPPAQIETLPDAAESEAAEPESYRVETGTASWYGREFQGMRTASGELFDMDRMTAAHRTLPLGTVVRVTDLANEKSVELTVNDRGPFVADRILDVSYGAARELGFLSRGTAQVRIESVEQQAASLFIVQVAVFAEEVAARLLRERLSVKYMHVWTVPFESKLGKFYRVFVGSYRTEKKAEAIAAKLKLEGLEPFVLRKD